MPVDGPIAYKVVLDPTRTSGDSSTIGHTLSGSFTPVPPVTAVEWFAPKTLSASKYVTLTVPPGSVVSKAVLSMGRPTSETSQQVVSDTNTAGMQIDVTTPSSYPAIEKILLSPTPANYSFQQNFTVVSSNYRANASKVDCTWAQIDQTHGQSVFAPSLASDFPCESSDPLVSSFVASVLPSTYRTTYTPLGAARRLFQAVASRIRYRLGLANDAVNVLKNGYGDCGGYSDLYVAALRHIGIPARVVSGWLMGSNDWHGWSEIYLPTVGWIPQDCTYCSSACQGAYAYYFMIMPDLNGRCIVSRGTEFIVQGLTCWSLQEAVYGWWGNPSPALSVRVTASLAPAGP
jgi:hypothetical protein